MKVTNISGIKIPQLVERGRIPTGLIWSKEFPPSYSINLIKNRENTKTIICATDSFGGGISYVTVNQNIELIGMERELEPDEVLFLRKNYPKLFQEIESL
jgi:hypothetical protein